MNRVPPIDLILVALAALLLLGGAVQLIVDVGHEGIAIAFAAIGFALAVMAERKWRRHIPRSHWSGLPRSSRR